MEGARALGNYFLGTSVSYVLAPSLGKQLLVMAQGAEFPDSLSPCGGAPYVSRYSGHLLPPL